MKVLHPEKHQYITRAGTKNSQQKSAAKTAAAIVESSFGRQSIVRISQFMDGGESMLRA